jgi:hypothetical protein
MWTDVERPAEAPPLQGPKKLAAKVGAWACRSLVRRASSRRPSTGNRVLPGECGIVPRTLAPGESINSAAGLFGRSPRTAHSGPP